MQPSTVNGIELGAQEWRDTLFLQHGLYPPDLPTHCDGCQAKFSISHILDCKKGGLVTARQKDLRDKVVDLAGKAFTPSHIREDLLIYSGCAVKRAKATPSGDSGKNDQAGAPPPEVTEQKGNLMICDLWQNGTDSVHDMRVVNTDAKSHRTKYPERCLQEAERGKKRMYLEAYLQQRRNFSPFVASVDGLLGVEAMATLKMLASCLATKWKQPYSNTCNYVKSRIAITFVRVTHRCIQGSQVPAHRISVQRPQWEDGAGLNLFR